ncbi:type IV secretory pathway TrbF-like protein [Bradyrhizobium sp. F1.13.1]
MAFGSLIVACGLVGGLVWQSTHGTVVRWVYRSTSSVRRKPWRRLRPTGHEPADKLKAAIEI